MKLIEIGYGSAINPERIVAVTTAEAAPIKRIIAAAKEKSLCVDCTSGKKTSSVFVLDSGHVILSAKNIRNFTSGEQKGE